MSDVIPIKQYIDLLKTDEEDIVKNTYQVLFEQMVNNKTIARGKRNALVPYIYRHVNSQSAKIRKWAYHCVCYCWNDNILNSIKVQLKSEARVDNILWALIALSVKYDTEEALRSCVGKRHDEFMELLSRNYIASALLLFGEMIDINPRTILLTNNPIDLIALTTVYGYNNLVADKYNNIDKDIIKEIRNNQNAHVREFGYWATVLRDGTVSPSDDRDDSDLGVLKWQFAGRVKNNDADYIVSILKPLAACPQKIHFEIKSGIIRGLQEIPYNSEYVPYINRWYSYENDTSISLRILDYMMMNCYDNRSDGTYFDAIKDSLDDESLRMYIYDKIMQSRGLKLVVTEVAGEFSLDFSEKGQSIMQMNPSISGPVSGSVNINMASDNSEAKMLINSSENDNSKELMSLIEELRLSANKELSDEDNQVVKDNLAFIEEETKKDKPKLNIIKNLLNGMKGFKGAVEFSLALAKLIDFFKATYK